MGRAGVDKRGGEGRGILGAWAEGPTAALEVVGPADAEGLVDWWAAKASKISLSSMLLPFSLTTPCMCCCTPTEDEEKVEAEEVKAAAAGAGEVGAAGAVVGAAGTTAGAVGAAGAGEGKRGGLRGEERGLLG